MSVLIQRRKNHRANERNWALSTLESLRAMDPVEFEGYVAWLYEKQGYWTSTTKASGDGGVDVYLYKDVLKRTVVGVVQCKRYQEGNKVSVKDCCELRGSHPDHTISYTVVTTSDFTAAAYEEVSSGKLLVRLINGDDLLRIIPKVSR